MKRIKLPLYYEEDIETKKEDYVDQSCLPYKEYYGQEETEDQVRVLKKLFDLNDDGTVALSYYCKTKEDAIKRVLAHEWDTLRWHR